MYVDHLTLHDFRSWESLDLALGPGVSAFVGRNGQGKTNIVEAIDYLSRLASHRVASDAPLVRSGQGQAIVRAAVIRDERRAVLEVEINPGRANRARINKSPLPRTRELVGLVRTVVFAPDDLSLVKGDPSVRRKLMDDLLVLLLPRYAGTRADYERVLKQRNSLLKSAGAARFKSSGGSASAESALSTLAVWDANLARLGAQMMSQRADLVDQLAKPLERAYETVAKGAAGTLARATYRPSFDLGDQELTDVAALEEAMLAELAARRDDELDRRLTLVGPHRDELVPGPGRPAGEGVRQPR